MALFGTRLYNFITSHIRWTVGNIRSLFSTLILLRPPRDSRNGRWPCGRVQVGRSRKRSARARGPPAWPSKAESSRLTDGPTTRVEMAQCGGVEAVRQTCHGGWTSKNVCSRVKCPYHASSLTPSTDDCPRRAGGWT